MERTEANPDAARTRAVWIVFGNALLLATILAVGWAAREVIGWTAVALLFALAMYPAVLWLRKRRVPRWLAVLAVCTVALGLISALVGTVVPLLVQQLRALVESAPTLLRRLEATAPVRWAEQTFGLMAQIDDAVHEELSSVAAPALAVAGTVVHGVFATVSVVVLTIFMLVFGEELFEGAMAWVKPSERERVRSLALRMRRVVGAYVVGTFLV
ncbi:MAG: AI-2E family transporter, partial [Polyangiaceae bacterium]|nr:AI-2E family transporter [Polyangiaceae bacterium]